MFLTMRSRCCFCRYFIPTQLIENKEDRKLKKNKSKRKKFFIHLMEQMTKVGRKATLTADNDFLLFSMDSSLLIRI